MNALNQHSSQPVLNHPKKDRQLPRRFKQAKELIVNSRQNPWPVQQPGRFAKQKRDQPRRVEASSQSSPPQRRPDTHSQDTYASVVSDSRQPQCMYPAPFLQNRLLMRDKMSAWSGQPLQMIAPQQHSVGPSSVSSSIATGRHDTDNMVNITDINTTVHYDNLICNITPDISDQSNSGHPLQLEQDFSIAHHM